MSSEIVATTTWPSTRPAETVEAARRPQRWAALPVTLLLAAIPMLYSFQGRTPLAVLWLFGIAFGIVLQRSRFCFASGFRDLFLFGEGRVLKGIIIGMAVATVGFALIMGKLVADPLTTAVLPARAGVYPLSVATILGGFLFGLGMVVAGGCASGTLYRIGEGYVASLVTLGGMLIGMYVLATTWGWWWTHVISTAPKVWLPHRLGWAGGLLVVLAALVLSYVLVLWWESRRGLGDDTGIPARSTAANASPAAGTWEALFGRAWPAVLGGLLLGILNVFEYLYQQPWGVTTEVALWAGWLGRVVGLPAEALTYYGAQPAGIDLLKHLPWLSGGAMINVGIIGGALLAALLSNEFKLRAPRNPKRYGQALVGGVLIGYGARLAQGCNIGAFFSAIPALAANGWVFAVGLRLGAYAGVHVIRRLA
ncbi:MAG TPA: YeeE/YedE family protein [Candidatus Acidoferrum sp.]|nr:YeeE/YedE family protein [Candidatus Acidoferrum sp.]